MIKKYETKDLQLNTELAGKPKGSVQKIQVDKNGVPIDRYWRDRIKDAEIDGCVKLVPATKKKK